MEQRTRRLFIVIGGSAIATGVLVLAACETDTGTSPLPTVPQKDGGKKKDAEDVEGFEEPLPDEDGGDDLDAEGVDCANAPRLRSNTNGFFCAFFRRDAAAGDSGSGSASNCNNVETCCNPARDPGGNFPLSFCAATPQDEKGSVNMTACEAQADELGTGWPGATSVGGNSSWACADKNNCAAGEVCCIFTHPLSDGGVNIGNISQSRTSVIPKQCGAKAAYQYGGTRCAPSCNAKEIKLCSSTDQNCEAPQNCTPFEIYQGSPGNVRNLAYCKP